MTTFEQSLIDKVREIRESLKEAESISQLALTIEVSGRTHEGELEIKFELGSQYSTGGIVKGGNLDQVVREYKRRFGWDEAHDPLMISFSPERTDENVVSLQKEGDETPLLTPTTNVEVIKC